ncbi:MAG: EAL domain-containing protein, partial [Bilophila sp.]
NHPTQGLIPPDAFIPLFEKNGFIIQLDEYIWEQACILLRTWIDSGRTPVPLSVNVSRMHIHDLHFCDKLLKLVTRYAIPPYLLKLELTESAFLENEAGLLAAMNTLHAHDFLFSMDDFGSGYSSLNMLKSLPIDTIKIDRLFLSEVVTTERGKTIIRHIIAMAHQMNIRIIAEGVETMEQALFLLESGCCLAQGYFYSRPVPVDSFEKMAYEAGTPPFPLAREIMALAATKACVE